jgi:hypothetical protein
MSWLSGRDAPEIINNVYQSTRPKRVNPNDVNVVQKISDIYTRHPGMPAGVVLSLAEGGSDMDMVDVVAQQSAKQFAAKQAKEAQTRPEAPEWERGNSPEELLWDAGKGIWKGTRWLLGNTVGRAGVVKDAVKTVSAALDTTGQVVQNAAAILSNDEAGEDFVSAFSRGSGGPNGFQEYTRDFLESTSLGALNNGDDSGSGFFLSGEAEVSRAEAARRVRGEINGHTWTIGRGAASEFVTPGTKPYMFLSG